MDISLLTSKQFKIKTKMATVTIGDGLVIDRTDGSSFKITGPGEYEVAGVSVVGTENTYIIETDGLRVCFLAQTKAKFSDAELAEMGSVDITLVPTATENKTIVEIARQTDPWVLIPDGFNTTDFLKEMGISDYQPTPKYTISRDKLPQDLQVVVLASK